MEQFQYNKHSFEQWIIQCCKADEWDLRKFLKKKLIQTGFIIKEDDYRSRRCDREKKYETIHNLLVIRGDKPRICLVSHTDVCRDHGFMRDNGLKVEPVLKNWGSEEDLKWIIQDKECKVQIGGDDRLGVAINTWIALNTGYDMGLLFTTDEEAGLVSANKCDFSELNEFDLLVQTDRGNKNDQIVNNIGMTKLCSNEVAERLLKIAANIGLPRDLVNGMLTDVEALRSNEVCKEAINLTVGYFLGHSNSEYIEVKKAREALKFVNEIIKHYDLELDKEEITNIKIEKSKEEIIIDGSFDIESYIRDYGIELKPKKEKNYKNLGRKNKKRKYIETILD